MKFPNKRLAITISVLRGLLLIIAGILALVFPGSALKVAAVVGGCLMIVDAVLGALASQSYGVEAHWPFWLSLLRGLLVLLSGLTVLFSPLLVSALAPAVIVNCVGVGAIAIGVVELFILLRYRKAFPPVWTSFVGALIYVALGATLLLMPFGGVLVVMQIVGGLLVLFGLVQVVRGWKASTAALATRAVR